MDLNELDIKAVQQLMNTGSTDLMPVEVVLYLEQLEVVRALYSKYKSKSLILKTLVATNKGLSLSKAEAIYCNSLNFFYSDNKVKQEAWRNIYAEMLDNAAKVAWFQNDMQQYRQCIKDAYEMRCLNSGQELNIPPELLDRRPIVYTNLSKQLNLKRQDRVAVGNYIDSIKDIPELERDRLKQEAGIETIDFLEEEEDGPDS